MRIEVFKQTMVLLPEGAVVIEQETARTLVVADLHLGKSAAFRAGGLPIPEGDDERDLARLAGLVTDQKADRVVVAGDLFHAPSGLTSALKQSLETFVSELAVPLVLVTGNHDVKLRRLPEGLEARSSLDLGGLRVVHDPADVEAGMPSICGHWHPVVRIPDGGRASLRRPCFLLRGSTLVLPAFGGFTGGAVITPQAGDRIFTGLRAGVVEIPAGLLKRR